MIRLAFAGFTGTAYTDMRDGLYAAREVARWNVFNSIWMWT